MSDQQPTETIMGQLVARAIAISDGFKPGEPSRRNYTNDARAAINAMMEKSVPISDATKGSESIIRQARHQHHMTLRELAKDVGLNFTTISHLEAGRITVSNAMLCRIADRLNLDADELLLRSGRIPDWIIQVLLNMPPAELVCLAESHIPRTDGGS